MRCSIPGLCALFLWSVSACGGIATIDPPTHSELFPDEGTEQADGPLIPAAMGSASASHEQAYFIIELSDAGSLTRPYDGWCVDADHTIDNGFFPANLHSTYAATPPNIVEKPENFGAVNYLVHTYDPGTLVDLGSHHEPVTVPDIQVAIWTLVEGGLDDVNLDLVEWSPERVEVMLEDTMTSGPGFVPGCGQNLVILAAPITMRSKSKIEGDDVALRLGTNGDVDIRDSKIVSDDGTAIEGGINNEVQCRGGSIKGKQALKFTQNADLRLGKCKVNGPQDLGRGAKKK